MNKIHLPKLPAGFFWMMYIVKHTKKCVIEIRYRDFNGLEPWSVASHRIDEPAKIESVQEAAYELYSKWRDNIEEIASYRENQELVHCARWGNEEVVREIPIHTSVSSDTPINIVNDTMPLYTASDFQIKEDAEETKIRNFILESIQRNTVLYVGSGAPSLYNFEEVKFRSVLAQLIDSKQVVIVSRTFRQYDHRYPERMCTLMLAVAGTKFGAVS